MEKSNLSVVFHVDDPCIPFLCVSLAQCTATIVIPTEHEKIETVCAMLSQFVKLIKWCDSVKSRKQLCLTKNQWSKLEKAQSEANRIEWRAIRCRPCSSLIRQVSLGKAQHSISSSIRSVQWKVFQKVRDGKHRLWRQAVFRFVYFSLALAWCLSPWLITVRLDIFDGFARAAGQFYLYSLHCYQSLSNNNW